MSFLRKLFGSGGPAPAERERQARKVGRLVTELEALGSGEVESLRVALEQATRTADADELAALEQCALEALAKALVADPRGTYLRRAVHALEALDGERQPGLTTQLAILQAQAGDAAADATFEAALAAAEEARDLAQVLSTLALYRGFAPEAWYHRRLDEVAVRVADLRGESEHAELVLELALASAELGRAEAALELAATIEDEDHREQAFAEVGEVCARHGDRDVAERALAQVEDPGLRDTVWHAVVAHAAEDDLERAVEATWKLEHVGRRALALRALADPLCRRGGLDRALELADELLADVPADVRAAVRTEIRIDAGDVDGACRSVAEIGDPDVRDPVLAELAVALERSDEHEAGEALQHIAHPSSRVHALVGVARVRGEAGRTDEALQVVDQILDLCRRVGVAPPFEQLVALLAELGDTDRAWGLAASFAGGRRQDALCLLAHGHARRKDLVPLEERLAEAEDPELRAQLLLSACVGALKPQE